MQTLQPSSQKELKPQQAAATHRAMRTDVCVDQLVDEFRAQHRGRFRFKNGLVGFRRNGRGPWLRDDAEFELDLAINEFCERRGIPGLF
jgi:hypothetical protein